MPLRFSGEETKILSVEITGARQARVTAQRDPQAAGDVVKIKILVAHIKTIAGATA